MGGKEDDQNDADCSDVDAVVDIDDDAELGRRSGISQCTSPLGP